MSAKRNSLIALPAAFMFSVGMADVVFPDGYVSFSVQPPSHREAVEVLAQVAAERGMSGSTGIREDVRGYFSVGFSSGAESASVDGTQSCMRILVYTNDGIIDPRDARRLAREFIDRGMEELRRTFGDRVMFFQTQMRKDFQCVDPVSHTTSPEPRSAATGGGAGFIRND